MAQSEHAVDVTIIGAGAAGLAAGGELTRAGRRIIILEARDRIGGRIHTVRDGSVSMPIELGAEFVHGRPPELMKIVKGARLLAYDAEGEHFHVEGGRLRKVDKLWGEVQKIMGKLEEVGPEDMTFEEFLNRCCNDPAMARTREMALAFVEGFDAAPAGRISAKALGKAQKASDESGGIKSLRIINGYDRVVEHLRQVIDSELGGISTRTIVKEVAWKRGEVEVRATGLMGEERAIIKAKAAIVTVPLGVLRAAPGSVGAIRFAPEVMSMRRAAKSLEMGTVVKIVIQFRQAFWEKGELEDMAFIHALRVPFATWWTFFPVRTNLLVGWAGGPSAATLIGKGEAEIAAAAIDGLARMLGMDQRHVEAQVERWWVYDWQTDPFARGAYSYVPAGAVDAVAELARSVEDTLFFAGEATDFQGYGGTVDSAISSGHRAAREVLGDGNR
jgi:monoamine oxidase